MILVLLCPWTITVNCKGRSLGNINWSGPNPGSAYPPSSCRIRTLTSVNGTTISTYCQICELLTVSAKDILLLVYLNCEIAGANIVGNHCSHCIGCYVCEIVLKTSRAGARWCHWQICNWWCAAISPKPLKSGVGGEKNTIRMLQSNHNWSWKIPLFLTNCVKMGTSLQAQHCGESEVREKLVVTGSWMNTGTELLVMLLTKLLPVTET